jgi:hypothetical protein
MLKCNFLFALYIFVLIFIAFLAMAGEVIFYAHHHVHLMLNRVVFCIHNILECKFYDLVLHMKEGSLGNVENES